MRRLTGALVAVALIVGLSSPPARADGDPASDVLLGNDVFVGYGTSTSLPLVRTLLQLTAQAKRRGLPIRVAVIRQPTELGAVASLFGKAQSYAKFLGTELQFVYDGTLVVAMGGKPGGIRIYGPGATQQAHSAVRTIAVPAAGDADVVVRIAATAVRAVATANDHPLATSAGSGIGGRTIAFAVAGGLTLVALAGGLVFARRRR